MSQSVLGVTPDLATLGTQRQGQNYGLAAAVDANINMDVDRND